jgi:RNA 2',3'-cyclic 3'-phosphodiesterase
MRLFIATQLPAAAVETIEATGEKLRGRLPRSGWVKPDRFHLTWVFLGEHEESAVERLDAALRRLSAHAVAARIAGAGFFPSISRARVGWLAVQPAEQLEEIAAAARHAVTEAHVAFDAKPFVPHLTIVRMRQPWKRPELELFVREMGAITAAAPIDHLSLFRSELLPEGAVHTELARVKLVASMVDDPAL